MKIIFKKRPSKENPLPKLPIDEFLENPINRLWLWVIRTGNRIKRFKF